MRIEVPVNIKKTMDMDKDYQKAGIAVRSA